MGADNTPVATHGMTESQLVGLCGSAISFDVQAAVNNVFGKLRVGTIATVAVNEVFKPAQHPLLPGMHNTVNFGGNTVQLVDAGCDLNTPFLPASFDPSFVIFAEDSVTLSKRGLELSIAKKQVQQVQNYHYYGTTWPNLYFVKFANGQRKVVAYVMGINDGPMMEDIEQPPTPVVILFPPSPGPTNVRAAYDRIKAEVHECFVQLEQCWPHLASIFALMDSPIDVLARLKRLRQ